MYNNDDFMKNIRRDQEDRERWSQQNSEMNQLRDQHEWENFPDNLPVRNELPFGYQDEVKRRNDDMFKSIRQNDEVKQLEAKHRAEENDVYRQRRDEDLFRKF